MRSGSAATARNGKIDVMPMTWKSACASESEKIAPSFALPYGRARKRTRRIRSATLWINRDKAVPDRKSTRLNSSHQIISYAVFCLKKKKNKKKKKNNKI